MARQHLPEQITVQINLSAGDLPYAHLTVPLLMNAHPAADTRLLVVDCTRPQRTKIVDPDTRFPEPEFSRKIERLEALANGFLRDGVAQRVVFLRKDDREQIVQLSKKYLAGRQMLTHDYGGCALMAYLLGFEAPESRYVVHYDADILLFSKPGFDWAEHAMELLRENDAIVAATPRISPPFSAIGSAADAPAIREGRPLTRTAGGWLDDWFSTRCLLIDRERMAEYLPLLRGRIFVETCLVKWLNRGYPRSPEILLFRTIGGNGGRRLNLATQDAWFIHPNIKNADFNELLPDIVDAVGCGRVPAEQRGETELHLAAWRNYIETQRRVRI